MQLQLKVVHTDMRACDQKQLESPHNFEKRSHHKAQDWQMKWFESKQICNSKHANFFWFSSWQQLHTIQTTSTTNDCSETPLKRHRSLTLVGLELFCSLNFDVLMPMLAVLAMLCWLCDACLRWSKEVVISRGAMGSNSTGGVPIFQRQFAVVVLQICTWSMTSNWLVTD